MIQGKRIVERSSSRQSRRAHLAQGFALLVLTGLLLSGCGYNLVGRASNLPEDIEKVAIEPLKNSTTRPQVEQILTNAISDEMITRRRFTMVNNVDEADAILRGNVLSFNVRPLSFDREGLANNFEVTITADMRFQRPPTLEDEEGEIVWSNSRYIFRQDYPVDPGEAFFDRENLAIEETAIRFAETMVTDLLEGF